MSNANDFDQELLELYDGYAHGQISRRQFLEGAAKFSAGGVTAAGSAISWQCEFPIWRAPCLFTGGSRRPPTSTRFRLHS